MLEPGDKEIFASIQNVDGVDMEQIRELRALTPAQRYERYRRAMESILWLKRAREHSRSRQNSQAVS